jgi:hypothetical protein
MTNELEQMSRNIGQHTQNPTSQQDKIGLSYQTSTHPNRFNDLESMSNLALPYIHSLADGKRNVAAGEDGDGKLWTPSNGSTNKMS